jgi:hypothetical protein
MAMDKGIGYSSLITNFIEAQYEEERAAEVSHLPEQLMPKFATTQTEVVERNGKFVVNLVYVSIEDPAVLLRVPVRVCRNRKIAEIIASYKCRLCACDQCIPLEVSMEDFGFAQN